MPYGVRAVVARLSAACVTEQRVLPPASAITSYLCILAFMPNLSVAQGALTLAVFVKGYGQQLGSTASARRPQGRGRRAHEVRP